jgi:hypothetical protein
MSGLVDAAAATAAAPAAAASAAPVAAKKAKKTGAEGPRFGRLKANLKVRMIDCVYYQFVWMLMVLRYLCVDGYSWFAQRWQVQFVQLDD